MGFENVGMMSGSNNSTPTQAFGLIPIVAAIVVVIAVKGISQDLNNTQQTTTETGEGDVRQYEARMEAGNKLIEAQAKLAKAKIESSNLSTIDKKLKILEIDGQISERIRQRANEVARYKLARQAEIVMGEQITAQEAGERAAALVSAQKKQSISKLPIEGLFGIKLGNPLPSTCTIILTGKTMQGYLFSNIIPPQTNAAFSNYSVIFDSSGRLVAEVYGNGSAENLYERQKSTDALLAIFRQRYGTNTSGFNAEKQNYYIWNQGQCSMTFNFLTDDVSWDLYCKDARLFKPLDTKQNPIDIKGL